MWVIYMKSLSKHSKVQVHSVIYLFIYNQSFLSATYTKTSGQLNSKIVQCTLYNIKNQIIVMNTSIKIKNILQLHLLPKLIFSQSQISA